MLPRVNKLALVLSAVFCLSAQSAQAQTVELKLSHFVPPTHPFHKWVTGWVADLEKESGGRLKFVIYPNGQIVGPPHRQFDAARNAVVDIAFSLHGVTPGRYAMTEIANLPYTWPKAGALPSVSGPRLTELAPTYLAAEHQGLRILFMAVANPVVAFSKVAVRKIEDFKGMKIRYAGVQNKTLLDTLGAVPMLVPPPESQDALAKGIVDAALFPYEAGVAYDLGAVVKYAIEPPFSTATFAMVMNPAKYNALPADLRALLDRATGVAGATSFGKAWEESERVGRAQLVAKGLEIIALPPADVEKIKQMMAPHVEATLADLEKQGRPARKFYQEYTR